MNSEYIYAVIYVFILFGLPISWILIFNSKLMLRNKKSSPVKDLSPPLRNPSPGPLANSPQVNQLFLLNQIIPREPALPESLGKSGVVISNPVESMLPPLENPITGHDYRTLEIGNIYPISQIQIPIRTDNHIWNSSVEKISEAVEERKNLAVRRIVKNKIKPVHKSIFSAIIHFKELE